MYKKAISIILIICICICTISTSAFAFDSDSDWDSAIDGAVYSYTVDVSVSAEEILVKAYENLSDGAKEIFNSAIASNHELVEYHRRYIDRSYNANEYSTSNINRSATDIISSGLSDLGLPVQVQEALNLLASGILAALADGPLVVGDIYALSISLYTAVVIAIYWDDIVECWDDIVTLFQQAYSTIQSSISDSMSLIEEDTVQEYSLPSTLTVTVMPASRTIKVNGTYYTCTIPVANFAPVQERFYPGMVYSGVFYVCPVYVPFKIARVIMSANVALSGVLTKFCPLAHSLCNSLGSVVPHPSHNPGNPNYLPHFHFMISSNVESNSHAWYIV